MKIINEINANDRKHHRFAHNPANLINVPTNSNEIEFETHHLLERNLSDIFHKINRGNPVRVLRDDEPVTKNVIDILKLAFIHGGMIVGGTARVIAHHVLVDNELSRDDSQFDLSGYLYGNYSKLNVEANVFKKARGDIDIVFDNVEAERRFIKELENQICITRSELSSQGFATELWINDLIRIQILHIHSGFKIHDRLRTFDIFNAMVAFDEHSIIVPRNWVELEKTRTIHCVDYSKKYVIHRISKWINKHDYNNLTLFTESKIIDRLFDYIENIKKTISTDEMKKIDLRSEQINFLVGETPSDEVHAILSKFRKFFPMLSISNLLMLTHFYPSDKDGYSNAGPLAYIIDRTLLSE